MKAILKTKEDVVYTREQVVEKGVEIAKEKGWLHDIQVEDADNKRFIELDAECHDA